MELSDRTIKSIAASLNLRQLRQNIINSNIANSETPGFKSKRIDFEEALARALDIDDQESMQVASPHHFNVGNGGLDNFEPEIYDDPNGMVSEDGNTVNRDQEMADMAENRILYDASVQLLNKKLGMLKYVINSER